MQNGLYYMGIWVILGSIYGLYHKFVRQQLINCTCIPENLKEK